MKTYRKYGTAPYQVALLHGGPGALGDLAPLAQKLAPYCSVLELLQTRSSIEELIQELYDQLQSEATVPVQLIGHSWGAWLAMIFAARYPALIRKLILIGVPPLTDTYARDFVSTRFLRMTETQRKEWSRLLEAFSKDESNQARDHLHCIARLIMRVDSYDLLPEENGQLDLRPELYQAIWQEAIAWRASGRILEESQKITCPVAVIQGADDPHPIQGVRKPLWFLSDLSVKVLKKCGHYPWRERWVRTVFLEELWSELTKMNDSPTSD